MLAIDIEKYDRDGVLYLADALDVGKLIDPVKNSYRSLFVELSGILSSGVNLPQITPDEPTDKILTALLARSGHVTMDHIDPAFNYYLDHYQFRQELPSAHSPELFQLITSPDVLDIVNAVLGEAIVALLPSHFWFKLSQYNLKSMQQLRLGKSECPPLEQDHHWKCHVANPPWHTHSGALQGRTNAGNTLCVWIPLTRTKKSNGGLKVVRGSHRLYPRREPATDELRNVVQIEANPGDMVLLHEKTFFTSTQNISDDYAWAITLRYCAIDKSPLHSALPSFLVRCKASEYGLKDAQQWQRVVAHGLHYLSQVKSLNDKKAFQQHFIDLGKRFKEFTREPERWFDLEFTPPRQPWWKKLTTRNYWTRQTG